MLIVYEYAKCSTCRNARRWLEARNIPHQCRPIRETPPSEAEFIAAAAAGGGNLRRLLNTSSQDYRDSGLKEILDGAKAPDAAGLYRLIQHNGNLFKRPFVVGKRTCLVGFRPDEWSLALEAPQK